MEAFKALLFGISGASLIFWVCVIAMWHVDMFPRIFGRDSLASITSINPQTEQFQASSSSSFSRQGALRVNGATKGLLDRGKYSRKSMVVADFSPVEDGYGVNRLYTSLVLSLGAMSFIGLAYGLQSGLKLPT